MGKIKGKSKGGGIVFNMHKIKLSNQRLVWLKNMMNNKKSGKGGENVNYQKKENLEST